MQCFEVKCVFISKFSLMYECNWILDFSKIKNVCFTLPRSFALASSFLHLYLKINDKSSFEFKTLKRFGMLSVHVTLHETLSSLTVSTFITISRPTISWRKTNSNKKVTRSPDLKKIKWRNLINGSYLTRQTLNTCQKMYTCHWN